MLAIAAGVTLCGKRGYKAIGQWAEGLGQKGAQRDWAHYRVRRGAHCHFCVKGNQPTVLRDDHGHWSVENNCHCVLDMTWDEERWRVHTGHGSEKTSRLRHFAISVLNLHAKPGASITPATCKLAAKPRLVYDACS